MLHSVFLGLKTVLTKSAGFNVVMSTSLLSEVRKIPRGSLKLSCKTSGLNFDELWLAWVRIVPGKGLQRGAYISRSNGEKMTSSEPVKRQPTISRDNYRDILYLQMTNMSLEDAAEYYCTGNTCSFLVLQKWTGTPHPGAQSATKASVPILLH
uniref:Ig-like domain-containing protein n=1 Tax=Apteryx owenii TaxID=8824 RepID=A0A8B9P4X1_APTOW